MTWNFVPTGISSNQREVCEYQSTRCFLYVEVFFFLVFFWPVNADSISYVYGSISLQCPAHITTRTTFGYGIPSRIFRCANVLTLSDQSRVVVLVVGMTRVCIWLVNSYRVRFEFNIKFGLGDRIRDVVRSSCDLFRNL